MTERAKGPTLRNLTNFLKARTRYSFISILTSGYVFPSFFQITLLTILEREMAIHSQWSSGQDSTLPPAGGMGWIPG